ncbi:hypothetical protein MPSEU_000488100 [Mayamaea pseudoterrestris]|nr:hypothetical protein MPSEU_000488100 [Mayamaea pseudoterrestris]
MKSSKATPQAKRPSLPRQPAMTSPSTVDKDKVAESVGQYPGNVEYVTLTGQIQNDSQFEQGGFIDYFSPYLVTRGPNARHGRNNQFTSPMVARTSSPYGFVPIEEGRQQRFVSPCPSPYDFRKPDPSPSMMSVATDTTVETLGTTFGSSMSPSTVSMTPPPLFRPNPCAREFAYIPSRSSRPPTPTSYRTPSPRPKTPTTNGRKSPFAVSVDDEAARKTRIKTEMCMHYVGGTPCPWGANCVYAHGEEELQMTKLLDLDSAGLVDAETYRIKPCFAWVMTGSCPFGIRCTCIHDPRVEGTSPSWLPHTETQGNSTATDINVDALHQKRSNEINFDTPFGHKFDLKNDSFADLYKTICNIKFTKVLPKGGRHVKQQVINPVFKLQIALWMMGSSDRSYYKYRPQHAIHDELCMVLQDRAFALTDELNVVEIPLESFNPASINQVRVTEIAFGPDGEATVRGVSLFFNIKASDVAMCTSQQAKRFRWKRGMKGENDKAKPTSKFDVLDSIEMIRPHDMVAFDFVRNTLAHRIAVLKAERIGDMNLRFEELRKLERQKQAIHLRFSDMAKSWAAWAWPINAGREKVDKKTPVPPVEGEYMFGDAAGRLGTSTKDIWASFVTATFDDDEQTMYPTKSTVNKSGQRLPIFQKLAAGLPLDLDRTLPLISKKLPSCMLRHKPLDEFERQKEHCWRALLLENLDEGELNEWDHVREHFDKSRSKKVLTIIQKKTAPSPVMGHPPSEDE